MPQHGEDLDIFERLYAVRLDRIRDQIECRELVAPLDIQGLLSGAYEEAARPDLDSLDDDALLAELGVEVAAPAITELTHVRSTAEKKTADEVAARENALISQPSSHCSSKFRKSWTANCARPVPLR